MHSSFFTQVLLSVMVASMAFATWSYTNESARRSIEHVTCDYQENVLSYVTSRFSHFLDQASLSVEETASLLQTEGVIQGDLTLFETLRTEVSVLRRFISQLLLSELLVSCVKTQPYEVCGLHKKVYRSCSAEYRRNELSRSTLGRNWNTDYETTFKIQMQSTPEMHIAWKKLQ